MKDTFSNYEKLFAFSKKNGLVEKSSIVLGLSGGPDSIFLLHFLAHFHHEGFISLIAAHLDHQWRADSAHDVQLCRVACEQLQIPFVTAKVSELQCSLQDNGSQEDTARQQRRFFFQQVRHAHKADLIALAHHADDQEETFFIRLIRGTALSGLVGMRARAGAYIRPLLCLKKQEILEYVHQQKIAYCMDTTNESNNFLRNRLRNSVLPALKQTDERFSTTFANTLEQLQATETFIETYAQQQYSQLITHDEQHHMLNIKQYLTLDRVIQHRVMLQWLRDYGVQFPVRNGFFAEITDFLKQQQGGTHRIHHDWMIVKKGHIAHIVIH